jgi:3(or 17)beta-hydroxysteroid dehydrogenase
MGRLDKKVALVTGAASGLGRATAQRLAEEGAQVVLSDIEMSALEKVSEAIGAHAVATRHDVTQETSWVQTLALVQERFGRLDIVVNNAGIDSRLGHHDPERENVDDWRRVLDVNLDGVYLGCKHAIPAIRASGGGAIINIASIAAVIATPLFVAYGATKAAVIQLTKSVASHAARTGSKVRCNAVLPGMIVTPLMEALWSRLERDFSVPPEETRRKFLAMIPQGAFQEPVDIANAVLFLASDEARCITGTQLIVDGGLTIHDGVA